MSALYFKKDKEEYSNIWDNYHLIKDVPINIFISMNDTLIKPADVINHY